jgi:hypothetical protein
MFWGSWNAFDHTIVPDHLVFLIERPHDEGTGLLRCPPQSPDGTINSDRSVLSYCTVRSFYFSTTKLRLYNRSMCNFTSLCLFSSPYEEMLLAPLAHFHAMPMYGRSLWSRHNNANTLWGTVYYPLIVFTQSSHPKNDLKIFEKASRRSLVVLFWIH